MKRRSRIGVFGGTFDPIHVGHLVVARTSAFQLDLDDVLFVVANVPWQKVPERSVTAAEHRLAMVEAALAGIDRMTPSAVELDRGGNSYTVDTLEALVAPDVDLFLILGSDAAAGLGTWKEPERVRDLATLVVIDRPGTAGMPFPRDWRVERVSCPMMDLSSSDLRARLAAGFPVDFLVPEPALRYIAQHGLYGELR